MKKTTFLIVGILLLSLFFNLKQCNRIDEQSNLLQVLNDTLKTYKDKNGYYIAEKKTFETRYIKTLQQLKTKDSLIMFLQEVVKDYRNRLTGGSVTVVKTRYIHDTIVKTDTLPIKKAFQLDYRDAWMFATVFVDTTKTRWRFDLKNDMAIVVARDRGLFSNSYTTYIRTKNPYLKVTGLQSYRKKIKIPRITVGVQAGYGMTKSGLGPYIGVGVNYSLLNFGFRKKFIKFAQ